MTDTSPDPITYPIKQQSCQFWHDVTDKEKLSLFCQMTEMSEESPASSDRTITGQITKHI